MIDFFISYNNADQAWAVWMAWQLEEAGYQVMIQAWDFRPGENFVLKMQQAATEAAHTLAVLSPDYLNSLYTQPEWATAFAQDPTGQKRTLIPIRVRPCELKGLLTSIIYIDMVGLPEAEARERLLQGIRQQARMKPTTPPAFPTHNITTERPTFPVQNNHTITIGGDVSGAVINQGTMTGSVSISINTHDTKR